MQVVRVGNAGGLGSHWAEEYVELMTGWCRSWWSWGGGLLTQTTVD